MIARGEFQPMMLGDRRLYRVGEFPAFATAQRGGAIGLSRIRQGKQSKTWEASATASSSSNPASTSARVMTDMAA